MVLKEIMKPDIGHGIKAEKLAAKRLGGELTFASGALEFMKGDFSVGDLLVENKCTVKPTLSIKLDWLRKISQEAFEKKMNPALAIQYVNPKGVPVPDGKWVMVKEEYFKELMFKDA